MLYIQITLLHFYNLLLKIHSMGYFIYFFWLVGLDGFGWFQYSFPKQKGILIQGK